MGKLPGACGASWRTLRSRRLTLPQEFKEKINRRDSIILALQEALGLLNEEALRFQNAVEEVEGGQELELNELKQVGASVVVSLSRRGPASHPPLFFPRSTSPWR